MFTFMQFFKKDRSEKNLRKSQPKSAVKGEKVLYLMSGKGFVEQATYIPAVKKTKAGK